MDLLNQTGQNVRPSERAKPNHPVDQLQFSYDFLELIGLGTTCNETDFLLRVECLRALKKVLVAGREIFTLCEN